MSEPVTIDRQIACVRDEIRKRKAFYPKWISAGKMNSDEAASRIAAMEAVEVTLVKLRDDDKERREPKLL